MEIEFIKERKDNAFADYSTGWLVGPESASRPGKNRRSQRRTARSCGPSREDPHRRLIPPPRHFTQSFRQECDDQLRREVAHYPGLRAEKCDSSGSPCG